MVYMGVMTDLTKVDAAGSYEAQILISQISRLTSPLLPVSKPRSGFVLSSLCAPSLGPLI